MYCAKCGTPNNEAARFCERCGGGLPAQAAAAAATASAVLVPPPPPSPQVVVESDPRVRGAVAYASPVVAAQPGAKNPAVALILSLFIPGAGQFYNGDNKRGILMLGGALLSALLAALTIGIFTGVAIWIWSMVNAYNVASGKTPPA